MTDFLKIAIFDLILIDRIWNNPLLEYCEENKRKSTEGEIITKKSRTYKNLVFEKHANVLFIKGSIHYLFNDGIHNANDFSFVNSIKTVLYLADKFSLDLTKCIIQNIEFGLNILPKEDVKNIVTWLKYHDKNEFYKDTDFQYSKKSLKYSRECKANFYKVLKAYAKGLHKFEGRTYADPNTIRIEVKSKETKYFKPFGIYTLADLLKPETYLTLSDELIKEWDNVLILEKGLKGKEKKLDKFLDGDFWDDCLNEYRNKFAAEKKKYSKIVNRYPENIHSEIKNKLKSKLDSFAKELKSSAISTGIEKAEVVQFPESIKMESAPIYNLCCVTKLPIRNQHNKTVNLTDNGIKWYYENEPETYRTKLAILLTRKWLNKNEHSTIDIYFSEIAHQIRNRKLNPNNNYFNRYLNIENKGLKLFPTLDLIPTEKQNLIKSKMVKI